MLKFEDHVAQIVFLQKFLRNLTGNIDRYKWPQNFTVLSFVFDVRQGNFEPDRVICRDYPNLEEAVTVPFLQHNLNAGVGEGEVEGFKGITNLTNYQLSPFKIQILYNKDDMIS